MCAPAGTRRCSTTRGDWTRRARCPGRSGSPARPCRRPCEALSGELRSALSLAIANVRGAAEAGVQLDRIVRLPAAEVILREAPVASAAVYVPGGRAPYPSTVVMGVVTAIAAGVGSVAVCSPPGPDGEIDPVVLAACRLAGAEAVYRMGGAQAIAALAYGTESVAAVDVIVGPGNLWVQEAKRQVSGQVGIDSFAGPSDLLVIADPGSDAGPIALDLLAQAEHGHGTLVVGGLQLARRCSWSSPSCSLRRRRPVPSAGSSSSPIRSRATGSRRRSRRSICS